MQPQTPSGTMILIAFKANKSSQSKFWPTVEALGIKLLREGPPSDRFGQRLRNLRPFWSDVDPFIRAPSHGRDTFPG